jgi:hypothetical protein
MKYRGTRKISLDSDKDVSRVIKHIAAGLREKAEKVTVDGTRISFRGVHERDAGNKMALFTSGSSGEVEVDRNSNMIRFQISLNDQLKGGGLLAGALNVINLYSTWKDVKPQDTTFSIFMTIAGFCIGLIIIGMVILSSIIHFNLFLNGRLGDAEYAKK